MQSKVPKKDLHAYIGSREAENSYDQIFVICNAEFDGWIISVGGLQRNGEGASQCFFVPLNYYN